LVDVTMTMTETGTHKQERQYLERESL